MAAARELGTSRAMVSYYTKFNSLLEPCRKEIDPCFELNFSREEKLPFAPFVGLDIFDDALVQFSIKFVAWHTCSNMFMCEAAVDRSYWNLRKAQRTMKNAGWSEDKEARSPY